MLAHDSDAGICDVKRSGRLVGGAAAEVRMLGADSPSSLRLGKASKTTKTRNGSYFS